MLNIGKKYAGIAKEAFHETLRVYKRRHALSTCEVADKTGLVKRSVDAHLTGVTAASFPVIMQYAQLFGADFLNDLLRPFGYDGVREIEGAEGCPFELVGHTADITAMLTKALRDQHLDHQERAALIPALDNLINIAQAVRGSLKKRGK